MKHYESLIIGHITMDHDTDYLGNETLAIGGAVIYSSRAQGCCFDKDKSRRQRETYIFYDSERGYILHHVRVVMHYG